MRARVHFWRSLWAAAIAVAWLALILLTSWLWMAFKGNRIIVLLTRLLSWLSAIHKIIGLLLDDIWQFLFCLSFLLPNSFFLYFQSCTCIGVVAVIYLLQGISRRNMQKWVIKDTSNISKGVVLYYFFLLCCKTKKI